MNILEHFENHLGGFVKGWKDNSVNDNIQVIFFEKVLGFSADVFATLGLSHHLLEISDKKKVRQELVFAGKDSCFLPELIVSCLFYVCEVIVENHKALLRGQVINLPPEVSSEFGFEAIYCTMPVFLDDNFSTLTDSDPPTVVVWLLLIHKDEASFIKENGWSAFEDLLENYDIDYLLAQRDSII